jgi:hypothetical protein
MRLLTLLIIRLMAVVQFCLAVAAVYLVWDGQRAIESDVASTATRVNQRLQTLYWQHLLWRDGMQRGALVPLPEWATIETQSIISPGVCVTFGLPRADRQKLCSQVEALGPPAPAWFASAYLALLGT